MTGVQTCALPIYKSFIVIAVNDEWYEEFTNALLKVRPEIEFSIKSKESGADDDKKST